MKLICPKCNGKGKVFDKMTLFMTVGCLVLWLTDDESLHKECPVCEGLGVIYR